MTDFVLTTPTDNPLVGLAIKLDSTISIERRLVPPGARKRKHEPTAKTKYM